MGGQRGDGAEEEWEHAHVHRLHRTQQGMPEGLLSVAKD
jgi:hypothetical protein